MKNPLCIIGLHSFSKPDNVQPGKYVEKCYTCDATRLTFINRDGSMDKAITNGNNASVALLGLCGIVIACGVGISGHINTPEKVATEIINSCEQVDSDCFKQCFQRDLTTARICVEMYNTIQKEEAYE